MNTVGERIFEVKNYFFGADRGSNKKFADAIGVSPNVVSNWFARKDGIGNAVIEKILETFPDVDKGWLVGGNGEMLNKKETNEQKPIKSYSSGTPYYNVDFIGGFDLILNDQTINPEYYIQFKPYDKATCWCNITGHSMEPEISHGDIIALREITDISFLPYGEIYAIVTTNEMRTVKRIGPSSNPDNYTLIPTNKSPEYGIQELPKNMILRIFEVMGCMKRF